MLKHWVIGIVASAASAFTASADLPPELIKAYNSAMGTQDTAQIVPAAEALAAAAVEDPAAPDATLIAFETASQLCLRGACARAADAARLAASGTGADLPPALERALLAAYAAYSAAPGSETLATLDGALSAIAAEPPTLISVNAFGARYVAEAKSGSPESLSREARRAADHFRPARDLVPQYWATAELTALITKFNTTTEAKTLLDIYELEYWLYDRLAPYNRESVEAPEWLRDNYYTTMAWRLAIETFVQMSDSRSSVLRKAKTRAEARAEEIEARPKEAKAELPFCSGRFEPMPAPVYPGRAGRGGFVGAILIGVAISDGEPGGLTVLAAVPDGVFERATLDSFRNVKWVFDADQPEPCDRSTDRVLVPFVYEIQ